MPPRNRTANRALTTLLAIVATILVGWVLTSAASILQPLVIAMLLCSVLQPVVKFMARFKIPPWLTVILLLSLLVLGMMEGGALFFSELRAYRDAGGFDALKEKLVFWLEEHDPPGALTAIKFVQEMNPWSYFRWNTVTDFLRSGFLVVIYMLFIFAEQAIFRDKLLAVARDPRRAERVLDSVTYGIQRYLGVKTVISLLTGGLCYVVLAALQVPYAPLFGFLTFLLNYIPTFGSIIAAILPIATSLAQAEGLTVPFIITITYIVVSGGLGVIIEPRLLGRELNLSPLVILVSVVVWAGIWGVPGAFLAVPLTAMVQIALGNIESTRPLAVLLSNGVPRSRPRPRRADLLDEESLDELEGDPEPEADPTR